MKKSKIRERHIHYWTRSKKIFGSKRSYYWKYGLCRGGRGDGFELKICGGWAKKDDFVVKIFVSFVSFSNWAWEGFLQHPWFFLFLRFWTRCRKPTPKSDNLFYSLLHSLRSACLSVCLSVCLSRPPITCAPIVIDYSAHQPRLYLYLLCLRNQFWYPRICLGYLELMLN